MPAATAFDTALGELNARLRAGRHRCSVERRRAGLSLRATLPERENPSARRQQRIPLELPAVYGSLPEAELRALELSRQLRGGTFDWSLWDSAAAPAAFTISDFRDAAAALHASKYAHHPERGAEAWRKRWAWALAKLPARGPATEAVLLRAIRAQPSRSCARRDLGNILCQTARSLGMPTEALYAAYRGYGAAQLHERILPTDSAIETAVASVHLPHWRWTLGMLATYGLRPHEAAGAEWLDDGWIRLGDDTKTGSRDVLPCPSRWVDLLELRTLPRPDSPARRLSPLLTQALRRGAINLRPYDLRHAYAVRLMTHGVPPELGARLMGHSLQMHEATYKRWLEPARLRQALKRFEL